MQGSSERSDSNTSGSAQALLAFSLQPLAFPRGVRLRANAGGSTPSPSLLPAPLSIFLFLVLSLFLVTGCSSTPTRLERQLFNVETNRTPQLVLATNIVEVQPAAPGLPPTWQTNITVSTNMVETYTYTPSPKAAQLVSVASSAASMLGPWGELVGMVLGGMFGAYGLLRSSRASKTATVLAQVIETGRRVLQQTPQGHAMEQQWKTWMIQHQAEQGVMPEVIKLLQSAVDEPSAKVTAQELVAMIKSNAPQP